MTFPRPNLPCRSGSRSGFTLVEILVVIAIIALLAGVALPAITGAIKKGRESAAVQTSHGIAVSMFQYNTDNGMYPTGTSSHLAFEEMIPNYISNTDVLWVSGAGGAKYSGTTPATGLTSSNVSWDLTERTGNAALTANDPDEIPLIMSTGGTSYTFPAATGAVTAVLATPAPASAIFGTDGLAIAYKDMSSSFVSNKTPGTAFNVSSASFTPVTTYTTATP